MNINADRVQKPIKIIEIVKCENLFRFEFNIYIAYDFLLTVTIVILTPQ